MNKLNELFEESKQGSNILADATPLLDTIIEAACSGRQKAVLAVVITLALKKCLDPDQDIRIHQKQMDGGFSGRALDTRVTTPFLTRQNFPYMGSGSGWLTRSLEQEHPYDFNYSGNIKPKELKDAFLKAVDMIEHQTVSGQECIKYLFHQLIAWREQHSSIQLSRPTNRRIDDMIDYVKSHWNSGHAGVAKLPTMAVYAAYECLISEVKRYKDCRLGELLSQTSADSRTNRVGDIDIYHSDGRPVEAIEIKHGIPLSYSLITSLHGKIVHAGVKRYYILSTREKMSLKEMPQITEWLISIRQQYGCQVIVNGVSNTLKYYLRLLSDTDKFINNYVSLVESDSEIPFTLKKQWNDIIEQVNY